ncbi:hypothetical protein EML15_09360 [Corynebacterium sp. sy017]|uniref:hypothetical protein n=1 Tax=unclassified Corynebacterium TaxID=2624378 RepID=UPI0011858F64|nr:MULTISPECIES: hypothetical protein [unclassified Corynebacterium]MBP3089347.1 hypothetical protein [Corynebacterium sp. sy017]TSD90957.1 hypothetical protein ELY17_09240 [Corynebacterium sp. SY003]
MSKHFKQRFAAIAIALAVPVTNTAIASATPKAEETQEQQVTNQQVLDASEAVKEELRRQGVPENEVPTVTTYGVRGWAAGPGARLISLVLL